MTVPIRTNKPAAIESALLHGDLSKLSEEQRISHYMSVCDSLGLNPLTQPFAYITLNGKLQLYALRAAADQLRKINDVSLEIVSKDITDGILTIHVRAKLPNGRVDEELGAVSFPETLKGEARVNAELKAVTKAKRRVTLSICGLGWLDETEVADIPAAARHPPKPAPNVMVAHDQETGEIIESSEGPKSDDAAPASPQHANPAGAAPISVLDMAREAAMRGKDAMRVFYNSRSKAEKAEINKIRPELDDMVDLAEADMVDEPL